MRYANDFGNRNLYILLKTHHLCFWVCNKLPIWRPLLFMTLERIISGMTKSGGNASNPTHLMVWKLQGANGWRFTLSEWNFQMQGSSVNIDPAKWSCNFEQKTPEKAWDSIYKNIIQAFGRWSNPCFFRPQDDPCRFKTLFFQGSET